MSPTQGMTSEKRREFWRAHIVAWQESGLSLNKYCGKQNFCSKSLRYWISRFPELVPEAMRKKRNAAQQLGKLRQVSMPLQSFETTNKQAEATLATRGIVITRERWSIDIPANVEQISLTTLLEQLGGD